MLPQILLPAIVEAKFETFSQLNATAKDKGSGISKAVILIMTLIAAKYGVFANPPLFILPMGIKKGLESSARIDKKRVELAGIFEFSPDWTCPVIC